MVVVTAGQDKRGSQSTEDHTRGREILEGLREKMLQDQPPMAGQEDVLK